jgi:hypothetical protein
LARDGGLMLVDAWVLSRVAGAPRAGSLNRIIAPPPVTHNATAASASASNTVALPGRAFLPMRACMRRLHTIGLHAILWFCEQQRDGANGPYWSSEYAWPAPTERAIPGSPAGDPARSPCQQRAEAGEARSGLRLLRLDLCGRCSRRAWAREYGASRASTILGELATRQVMSLCGAHPLLNVGIMLPPARCLIAEALTLGPGNLPCPCKASR